MQQSKSVMNGLVHIGDRIAEASKKLQTAKNEESAEAVQAPQMQEPQQKATEADPILNTALLHRLEELCRTKQELSARLENEAAELRAFLQGKEHTLHSLEQFMQDLQQVETSMDHMDQGKLAASCRQVENIRLAMVRMAKQEEAVRKTEGAAHDSQVNLTAAFQSLTFSQIAGFGFSFFFPLILTISITGILLILAIVLSLNGKLGW